MKRKFAWVLALGLGVAAFSASAIEMFGQDFCTSSNEYYRWIPGHYVLMFYQPGEYVRDSSRDGLCY